MSGPSVPVQQAQASGHAVTWVCTACSASAAAAGGVMLLALQLVEGCMPLHGITLPNKIGKPVAVPKLPLM